MKHQQAYHQMRQLSQEHKEKLRKFNLGKHLLEETKEKIRIAHLGKKLSEEHKRKIRENSSKFWLGKKRPNIRGNYRKGHIPWNKGKKHTEETKQKIREKAVERIPLIETRIKMSVSRTGKKKSQETKNKLRGKNHYNWKGGITKLTEQIRNSFEYRQWRSDIFTKDNFICQNCGQKGGKLVAHHIKKFSKILEEYKIKTFEQALNCEELWNINNGRTLCEKCHIKLRIENIICQ